MPGTRHAANGPRTRPLAALTMAALLCLPACYARRPIPSDPPEESAPSVPAVAAAPVASAKAEPAAQPSPQPAAQENATAAAALPVQDNATAPAAQAAQDNATAAQEAALHTYYVQIGAFTTEKNANGALIWLKDRGYTQARVVRVEQGATTYHRVQAGPYVGYALARKALDELKKDWPAFIPGD